MHPFISVVIPVYNAEKYLRQCVESVLAQTYDDFEIILVNDGSKDASGVICDELAPDDGRIRVIHKENGGAADTRNRGIREAKGDYIAFVDADDYIAPDYLSYLVQLLNTYGVSVSICDSFWTESRNVDFALGVSDTVITMDAKESALSVINEYGLKTLVPWGKLLPAELVRRYPFPVGRRAEDEATLYKILYEAGGCVLSLCKLYGYYQNEAGLMHQVNEKHRLDGLINSRERWQFFEEKGDKEIATTMYGYYVCELISHRLGGHTAGTEELDTIGILQFMKSGVRPLYVIHFLLYKLFHVNFIRFVESIRR